MPGQNEMPEKNNDLGPLKKWLTKKEAMKFLDVERTTFSDYKKLGLKTSKIRSKEKVSVDDLDEFIRSFLK